jgi:2-amino-4-hydroxy-6-hydroxymethyldihydropteridine diphosphokinase
MSPNDRVGPPKSELAFISLGSNLGDSKLNVERAIERLAALSPEPMVVSSLYETTPVDCPPGSPPFINAAAALLPRAEMSAEILLESMRAIEVEFGRAEKVTLNEPRTLDLDLISFRKEIRNTDRLILPHPRAHLRRFVLMPLAEIFPTLILPGQRKSVARLLRELNSDEDVSRL